MIPILEIQNISKRFKIQHLPGGYLSFRESLVSLFNRQGSTEEFWALDDVSFTINQGESIGIIGSNGAGKSTLLKVLSRITPPTEGRVICRGRVASLLEVGTGFHPELSGRENIYFNGSLLGMSKKEITDKFDDIVEFAGTEKFLDTPIKHYSSGMQLRLAFSVAAFLEPEILVIDEVLAVGDAEFQKKCLSKMDDVSKSGRTIIFVSHNMAAVGNLCTRAVLLQHGRVKAIGPVAEIIRKYQDESRNGNISVWEASDAGPEPVYFRKIVTRLTGEQPHHSLLVECNIVSKDFHKDVFLAFDISNGLGVTVMQAIPEIAPFIKFQQQEHTVSVQIDLPPLIPDLYKVSVWMGSHNTETLCWKKEVVTFEVLVSPSKGRNFPHAHQNGFVVPPSRILND